MSEHIRRATEKTSRVKAPAEAITPTEMLTVIHNLMSRNSVWEFQFAVLIILLTSIFCRSDDVLGRQKQDREEEDKDALWGLQIEDIYVNQSCIQHGRVDYLVIEILGKREKVGTKLVIWRNELSGALCPVVFLLWWLCVSGITSGYAPSILTSRSIFRCKEWVHDMLEGTNETESVHLDPKTASDHIKAVIRCVCPHKKIGTHTCRKSGCFFAILGGAQDSEIKKAMRIKSDATLVTYTQDSKTLMLTLEVRGIHFKHLIGRYRYALLF
jgi:hypothetical protein